MTRKSARPRACAWRPDRQDLTPRRNRRHGRRAVDPDLGLATANYWALTQSLVPASRSAAAAGMQNAAGHLATVVAPWLTGWLVEHSGRFHAPVQVAGLVLVLGVFAYGYLVRR